MTDTVPWLLGEDLGQREQLAASEALGQVHHLVGGVLLFAGSGSGKERAESRNGKWVALLSSARGSLTEKQSSEIFTCKTGLCHVRKQLTILWWSRR